MYFKIYKNQINRRIKLTRTSQKIVLIRHQSNLLLIMTKQIKFTIAKIKIKTKEKQFRLEKKTRTC